MRARLSLVIVGLVMFSACVVEIDVATTVEEDGSGEMAVRVMLGETVRSTLQNEGLKTDDPRELAAMKERGEDTFKRGPNPVDVLERDVPPGWQGERLEEGKIEGIRLRARFDSLDEIPGLLEPFADFGDEVAERVGRETERIGVAAVVRGFSLTREGDLFRFRAEPDVEEYEGATGGPNKLLAEFTISMKLPGGVREHDADEEKDGALIWHIVPGTSRTISATSDLDYDPTDFPTVPVAVGASMAGLAGLLTLRHLRGRRRNGGGPTGPGTPDDEPVLV